MIISVYLTHTPMILDSMYTFENGSVSNFQLLMFYHSLQELKPFIQTNCVCIHDGKNEIMCSKREKNNNKSTEKGLKPY
jgi:Na+-translocating ferredoxin:NAD+ oxidoreductase RnfE subunit